VDDFVRLELGHADIVSILLRMVISNGENPERSQQLIPSVLFAREFASHQPEFAQVLTAASTRRLNEIISDPVKWSVLYLESALTWFAQLVMNNFVTIPVLLSILDRVIATQKLDSAIQSIRTCLFVCGAFLDRSAEAEVSKFYDFLRENRHSEGLVRFFQAELLALRHNQWKTPPTAAIENARLNSDSKIKAEQPIDVSWDEIFKRWCDGGEIEFSDFGLDEERLLGELLALIARRRHDLEDFCSFTAQVFLKIVDPSRLLDVISKLMGDIESVLPESTERKIVGEAVLDVITEICCRCPQFTLTQLLEIFFSIRCLKPGIREFVQRLVEFYAEFELQLSDVDAERAVVELAETDRLKSSELAELVLSFCEFTSSQSTELEKVTNPYRVGLYLCDVLKGVTANEGDFRAAFRKYSANVVALSGICPDGFVVALCQKWLESVLKGDRADDRRKWDNYLVRDLGIE
jgi:hypothetical protein